MKGGVTSLCSSPHTHTHAHTPFGSPLPSMNSVGRKNLDWPASLGVELRRVNPDCLDLKLGDHFIAFYIFLANLEERIISFLWQ